MSSLFNALAGLSSPSSAVSQPQDRVDNNLVLGSPSVGPTSGNASVLQPAAYNLAF